MGIVKLLLKCNYANYIGVTKPERVHLKPGYALASYC